nr:MAG TPA: hypothetical protein [Caudoviricetes sp.]
MIPRKRAKRRPCPRFAAGRALRCANTLHTEKRRKEAYGTAYIEAPLHRR